MNKPPPADARPRIHVETADDEHWTWRYVDEKAGLELHSNETFSSREVAVDWARRAYPDVPFADEDG